MPRVTAASIVRTIEERIRNLDDAALQHARAAARYRGDSEKFDEAMNKSELNEEKAKELRSLLNEINEKRGLNDENDD